APSPATGLSSIQGRCRGSGLGWEHGSSALGRKAPPARPLARPRHLLAGDRGPLLPPSPRRGAGLGSGGARRGHGATPRSRASPRGGARGPGRLGPRRGRGDSRSRRPGSLAERSDGSRLGTSARSPRGTLPARFAGRGRRWEGRRAGGGSGGGSPGKPGRAPPRATPGACAGAPRPYGGLGRRFRGGRGRAPGRAGRRRQDRGGARKRSPPAAAAPESAALRRDPRGERRPRLGASTAGGGSEGVL